MRSSLISRSGMVALLCIAGATEMNAQTQSSDKGTRPEAATFFGGMIANKELGRGTNATGGERLSARLNYGAALGLRGGLHNELLGLEVNFLTTSNRAGVKNEFGVVFPNHAERPLICTGDALLYPFRRSIKGGNVRPYLTSGVGGMLLSADLDNINDKETHGNVVWNAGGGVKVSVRESTGLYVDVRFTNHRLLRSANTDVQSISIGVGARF
jgi:opacity protein-like surface antigen